MWSGWVQGIYNGDTSATRAPRDFRPLARVMIKAFALPTPMRPTVSWAPAAWDLVPVAGGTLTMLFTSVTLALVSSTFGPSLQLLHVWFLPVGALACGAFAASGYYVGATMTG